VLYIADVMFTVLSIVLWNADMLITRRLKHYDK